MEFNRYNFILGTSRGPLISIAEKPTDVKSAKPEFSSEITALQFGKSFDEILIGYENGIVHVFNMISNEYVNTLKKLQGEGRIVGLDLIKNNVIASKQNGVINFHHKNKSDYFSINLDQKSTLNASVINKFRENILGTGGECNDLKLWNIETRQCIFKAKSLGHDMLNLPIPTSVRDITFFQEDEYLSACCTKEGHVLLYDDRAQRRPVIQFLEKQASYTNITSAHRERQCLVGTTRGYLQLLDMKMGKCMKTFKGFTGSITGIYCDPLEPLVATTSLDRHLRIHNLETKELLHKIYLKQNLTNILVKPILKEEKEEGITSEENLDEEYEDIFRNMEEIKEPKTKKRKPNQNGKKNKKKKIKNIPNVES